MGKCLWLAYLSVLSDRPIEKTQHTILESRSGADQIVYSHSLTWAITLRSVGYSGPIDVSCGQRKSHYTSTQIHLIICLFLQRKPHFPTTLCSYRQTKIACSFTRYIGSSRISFRDFFCGIWQQIKEYAEKNINVFSETGRIDGRNIAF